MLFELKPELGVKTPPSTPMGKRDYSLEGSGKQRQQDGGKAKKTDASTGLWTPLSPDTAAGWSDARASLGSETLVDGGFQSQWEPGI